MSVGQYESSQSGRVTGKCVASLDFCHREILEVFRKFPRRCRDKIVASPKHTHLAEAWKHKTPGSQSLICEHSEGQRWKPHYPDTSTSEIKAITLKVSLLVLLARTPQPTANHSWIIQWKQTDKHSTQELVYKGLVTKPSTCYEHKHKTATISNVCPALWSPNAQFNGAILQCGIEILFCEK